MGRVLTLILVFILSPGLALAKAVVFWLSIDGFSPDYLDRAQAPRIKALLSRSLFSRQLVPTFPSITFPAHVSEVTGVKVEEHGIPGNAFYDTKRGELFTYPDASNLLEAEPIWETVKRQGKRSAVFNWPLSHKQGGEHRADLFLERYQKELSDEERLEHVLAVWERELSKGRSLDLIMAYLASLDSAGHRFGPGDKRVLEVLENLDRLVGKIQDKIVEVSTSNKEDEFFILLTTDHGMAPVEFGVNLELMAGVNKGSKVRCLPSGAVAHIFLDQIPANDRLPLRNRLLRTLSAYDFLRTFPKERLPKEWGYRHPSRVGDIVAVLDKGYVFTEAVKLRTPIKELGGPLGMHGYPAEVVKEMKGLMLLWRWPLFPQALEESSEVSSLSLHTTVAELLGVSPSPKTKANPLPHLRKILRRPSE